MKLYILESKVVAIHPDYQVLDDDVYPDAEIVFVGEQFPIAIGDDDPRDDFTINEAFESKLLEINYEFNQAREEPVAVDVVLTDDPNPISIDWSIKEADLSEITDLYTQIQLNHQIYTDSDPEWIDEVTVADSDLTERTMTTEVFIELAEALFNSYNGLVAVRRVLRSQAAAVVDPEDMSPILWPE